MTPQEKYIATARLGEGVIYTVAPEQWLAGIIIKQRDEVTVDLIVFDVYANPAIRRAVLFDPMAEKPGTWSNRPKT